MCWSEIMVVSNRWGVQPAAAGKARIGRVYFIAHSALGNAEKPSWPEPVEVEPSTPQLGSRCPWGLLGHFMGIRTFVPFL